MTHDKLEKENEIIDREIMRLKATKKRNKEKLLEPEFDAILEVYGAKQCVRIKTKYFVFGEQRKNQHGGYETPSWRLLAICDNKPKKVGAEIERIKKSLDDAYARYLERGNWLRASWDDETNI